MKKTISLILSLLMMISAVTCVDFSAFAAASINSQEVSLYYLKSDYAEKISIASGYNKSFQLKVSGASNVSYRVISGDSAKVSSSGLIEPESTTWYYYGNVGVDAPIPGREPDRVKVDYEEGDSVIQVKADSQIFNVTVHVYDYVNPYAENVMNDYIKANYKSSMTDYEKIELCAKFPASYDYDLRYYDAVSMIIFGGGSCWASTDAIIRLARKMGFDAWARNGSNDPGAGIQHANAVVQVTDGSYYIVEAGFVEKAPRTYELTHKDSLFSYYTNDYSAVVYQYDGKTAPETLIVPSEFDGLPLTEVLKNFLTGDNNVKYIQLPNSITTIGENAFSGCTNLESINLPAALTTLDNNVFSGCLNLLNITSSSPNYPASGGMIYDKNKTKVLMAPAVSSINTPASVKTIGENAFTDNMNIKDVVLPESITAIEACAFDSCRNIASLNLDNGNLKTIGESAFQYCTQLRKLVIPATVTSVGSDAFYYCARLNQVTVLNKNCTIGDDADTFPESAVLYGYKGSTLDAYAKKYNREFVSIDNCSHASTTEIITKNATCSQEGSKDVRCNYCDKVIKSNVVIPKTAHTEVIDVKAVNATCTAAGKTAGSHCSVCNQVLSVSKTIPATGHSCRWQAENGYLVKKCSNCKDVLSKLQFTDIQYCSEYGDYIEYTSVFNKFITGTNPPANNVFSPTAPINRAMFVTILYRMAGSPYDNGNNPYKSTPFTDITNTSAYYYHAACWALENGITTETVFKPFDNVTREQAASMLFRYATANDWVDEAYKTADITKYPDYSSVHIWAQEPMQWANYNKMITGTQQGYLNPQGATQRVHATKILYGFGTSCGIGNFE